MVCKTDLREAEVRAMVLAVARVLTSDPEQIQLSTDVRESETVFHLDVRPDEMGKLVGKGGRTARAIRVILHAASMTQMRRYTLDIARHDAATQDMG
jgi:predicted RNA-binding protein YlqC (UPF0109 family)